MKKINRYFSIGTIGTILTSLLQIITTLYISTPGWQTVFYILYPIFIILLIIGYRKIVKEKHLV